MRYSSMLLAALLLAPASSSIASTHAPKYKIRWWLGHQNLDYFEAAAADFKKTVESASHGDIAVEIVTQNEDAPGESASGAEIAEQVSAGKAEMGHSFTDVMGNMDHRLWSFEAPFLARGDRHMEGVLDGAVGDELLADLKDHDLVGLSFTYSGGPSGVATTDREIRRPEDLKGLKVGVYGDEVNAAWLKALGATPVPIRHRLPELLGLASSGAIDAVVITWRNFERSGLDRSFKYMNLPGSTYLVSVTYANRAFFASLPKDYQDLIVRASREAGRVERAKTLALNESAMREMTAEGVRPVYLTEKGRRAFADALKPADQAIEAIVGRDVIRKIRQTPDAAAPAVPAEVAISPLKGADELFWWMLTRRDRGAKADSSAAADPWEALALEERVAGDSSSSPAKRAEALREVGELRLRLGDHEGASEAFKSALAIEPANADALYELAQASRGQPDLALGYAQAAAAAARDGHQRAMADVLIAEVQFDLGDPAAAARSALDALHQDGRNLDALEILARADGGSSDQAARDARRVFAAAKMTAPWSRGAAYRFAAHAFQEVKDIAGAETVQRALADVKTRPRLGSPMGDEVAPESSQAPDERVLTQAVARDPDDLSALGSLIELRDRQDRRRDAAALTGRFADAVKWAPTWQQPAAYVFLCRQWQKLGSSSRAKECATLASEYDYEAASDPFPHPHPRRFQSPVPIPWASSASVPPCAGGACRPDEVFSSPDGSRAVWIQGAAHDAYLYDRTASGFAPFLLDWDVSHVDFTRAHDGSLAAIVLTRYDGAKESFDRDGGALDGPSSVTAGSVDRSAQTGAYALGSPSR